MINEFVSWWSRQMRDILPRPRPGALPREAIVADIDGAVVAVARRRRGRETPVGRFEADDPDAAALLRATLPRPGRGGTVVLRPAPSMILERDVALPLAAERDLTGLLGYEMDRLTPFRAEDLVWTGWVAARDRAADRLLVRLAMVPRARLAPALALLATDAGIAVMALLGPRLVALDGAATRRAVRQRRTGMAALAVCAALACAVVAVPVLRQSLALDAVDQRIAAIRPRVDQAEALRRRIATAAARVDAAAAERARVGDALAILAAVTDILPDDTYLSELTLAQRKLGLRGQSAAAARLIAALAADPALRNPVFAAPVTRNEAAHTDIFAITAEARP